MRGSGYYWFAGLMIFFMFSSDCFAVAVPKYNGKMNRSVVKIVEHKLHKKYPFAANDPHFNRNAVIGAIESGLTTFLCGAIVGTSWPVVLAMTTYSAFLGYSIPLAIDKGIEWIFSGNKRICPIDLKESSNESLQTTSTSPTIVFRKKCFFGSAESDFRVYLSGKGRPVYFNEFPEFSIENFHKYGSDRYYRFHGNTLTKFTTLDWPKGKRLHSYFNFDFSESCKGLHECECVCKPPKGQACGKCLKRYGVLYPLDSCHEAISPVYNPKLVECESFSPFWQFTCFDKISGSYIFREFGFIASHLQYMGVEPLNSYDYPSFSVEQTIDVIPEEMIDDDLSPEMLACAADLAWHSMNLSGNKSLLKYSYDYDDPITVKDVQECLKFYPDLVPSVGDFLAPMVDPDTDLSPVLSLFSDFSMNDIDLSRVSKTDFFMNDIDLNRISKKPRKKIRNKASIRIISDIDSPILEEIPTAEAILRPILNLIPDLKKFSVSSHLLACPITSFTILGKEHHWNGYCELIEQHRVLIESFMILIWSIMSLRIVLRT